MANLPPIDLKIAVDDKELKNSLNGTVGDLKRIQKESGETDKALDKAFQDDQVQSMNKSLNTTQKELDQVGKEAQKSSRRTQSAFKGVDRSLRRSGTLVRRFRRGFAGIFRLTGIGIFLGALGGISDKLAEVGNNALDALGPVGDTFRGLINTGRDFLSTITFGLIDSTATLIAGLEKETEAVLKNQRKLQAEIININAQAAIKRAEIEGASESELAKLRETARSAEIQGIGDSNDEILREINDLTTKQFRLQIKADNATDLLRRRQFEKEVEETEEQILKLEKIQAENNARIDDINGEAIKRDEDRRKAANDKRIAEEEKEAARLKREAKIAATKEEQRLKKELELRLTFLFDERGAQEERLRENARIREQEVAQVIKSEDERAILIEAIRTKLAEDLRELNDKFRKEDQDAQTKALNEQLQAEETALNARITQRQSELEQTQALQRQQFFAIEQTEKDVETFEALQQSARLEQELRFQKERLELTLRFGQLRTEAERDAIEQQIATIDTLINELNSQTANQQGKDPDAGFLAQLFGLTGPQVEALKKATQEVIKQINSILDTRLNALDKEIEAREENLNRLDTILAAETELLRAGEAANVQGTLDQIAEEEAAQEKALKKRKAIAIAKQTIDAVTQASSLITASAQIFAAFAPLQPVGIPLAIATIASMFAAFAAAQATAFATIGSSEVALNTGGRIMTGEKDTEGGRGLRVEGTNLKVGRGEWIVNATDSEEQNEFLAMLNAGMFRGKDLAAIARGDASKMIRKSEHKSKQKYARKIERMRTQALKEEINKQTKVLSQDLNDLYEKPQFSSTDKGYIKHTHDKKGNSITQKFNLNG